eukprot:TRINITY_DN12302_c2_g1_i1.p1 TRINITY_DN12302_c2_g1~~TRINITY_DN12302_c2_g1_i1.p1  ORF type:complete len:466 (+),score=70.51 TRINITY_DN12302_c2_g1_i1:108-1505(+)
MEAKRAKAFDTRHPFGVQPEGNRAFSTVERLDPLGHHVDASLPHTVVLEILSYLDGIHLARIAQTCKFLYVLSHTGDLWKALVIRKLDKGFLYTRSWKETYVANLYPKRYVRPIQPLPVRGIFSDVLYVPWMLATTSISPDWLAHNNMAVVKRNISSSDFRNTYERPGLPCKLTNVAEDWQALRLWRGSLSDLCSDIKLDAFDEYLGSVQLTMAQYMRYAQASTDPRPLYIFEPRFVEKLPQLQEDWHVPEMFDQDLMAVLGPGRPDHRWLLAGPTRTGTNFHVDPNYTAAWNTVVYGRKKWIMFPPDVLPPGLELAGDRVEQAESVLEWFVSSYSSIHEPGSPWAEHVHECVCEPGETVYIPAGWWHLVLNLETTVAITQNYVSEVNLAACLRFLKSHQPAYMNHAGPDDLEQQFRTALVAKGYDRLVADTERTSLWDTMARSNKATNDSKVDSTRTFAFGFAT